MRKKPSLEQVRTAWLRWRETVEPGPEPGKCWTPAATEIPLHTGELVPADWVAATIHHGAVVRRPGWSYTLRLCGTPGCLNPVHVCFEPYDPRGRVLQDYSTWTSLSELVTRYPELRNRTNAWRVLQKNRYFRA